MAGGHETKTATTRCFCLRGRDRAMSQLRQASRDRAKILQNFMRDDIKFIQNGFFPWRFEGGFEAWDMT